MTTTAAMSNVVGMSKPLNGFQFWGAAEEVNSDARAKAFCEAQLATWKKVLRKRLAVAMQPDRHFPGAVCFPISERLGEAAVGCVEFALSGAASYSPPFVVPCEDGSLQFEWHNNHIDLEISFEVGGGIEAWLRDKQSNTDHEETGSAAIELLSRWSSRLREDGCLDEQRISPQPARHLSFA